MALVCWPGQTAGGGYSELETPCQVEFQFKLAGVLEVLEVI